MSSTHGRLSSIDGYADWVAAEIGNRGWAPAAVCGHSMGGAMAQTLALRYPGLLGALVLVGTGARLKVLPNLLASLSSDYPAAVDSIMKMAFGPSAPASMLRKSARQMLRVPVGVTLGDFQACDRFDIRAEVERIRVPTLIICGSEDRMTPPRYAEFLKEKIPASKLVLIPGAGHMVMLEKPDEVNAALADFLAGLP